MASSYLTKTFGTPTDQNKWTWSGWVKLGQTPNDSIFLVQEQIQVIMLMVLK